MDKETRNRIQRATQTARELLEHEYAEQLEGVFDIRLDGTVASTPGEHLDAAQRVLRQKLLTAIEHQRASGIKMADAVAAYVREAAFTTLNRFVALKMLEARELVQECISRGDQSAGFKEFTGLAPGLVQLPDHGYRAYIESLFDEIGREVRVLFDRRDPASLLWPRRQALLDLFGVLNATELASVWAEDETIGWVYQYFNSDEERKQMRAESQAPRNSRELAVRNQFFTPRYVVQFLTDNTLGRIWYEMRQGDTQLRDLDYLVRNPDESFLSEGQTPPPSDGGDGSSGETDASEPILVPFRAKKDPRDIRVLDPACGSGHFLLYAFDLLQTIYSEAWEDESSPESDVTARKLRQDYPDIDSLTAAIPSLILRYNLHGIDIDTRCAQIAALATWMRAQRGFRDSGISRGDRPAIEKTNIVVAEPMPGEPELRREFIATLDPKLGRLVGRVFECMELAGEAGSLLPIESYIRKAVHDIFGEHGELFQTSDLERWHHAEEELLRALDIYAQQASKIRAFQRRLFAEDAERGLGFIDLCRGRYDVVLMNPPFGEGPPTLRRTHAQDGSSREIASLFVSRGIGILRPRGRLGVLASRLVMYLDMLSEWREAILRQSSLSSVADLGHGVLDGALVEAAALVIAPAATQHIRIFRTLENRPADKGQELRRRVRGLGSPNSDNPGAYQVPVDAILRVPGTRVSYWAPAKVLHLFSGRCIADVALVSKGLETGNDERFLRLWWEVPQAEVGQRWKRYAKGGDYAPLVGNLDLVFDDTLTPFARRTTDSSYYGRPGITYTQRTTSSLSFRALPSGVIFSPGGPAAIPFSNDERILLLSYMNADVFQEFVELSVGSGDAAAAGTAARNYTTGIIKGVPYQSNNLSEGERRTIEEAVFVRFRYLADSTERECETSPYFAGALLSDPQLAELGPASLVARHRAQLLHGALRVLEDDWRVEQIWRSSLGLERDGCDHVWNNPIDQAPPPELAELAELDEERIVRWAVEKGRVSRSVTKLSFVCHRRLELVSRVTGVHPTATADYLLSSEQSLPQETRTYCRDLLSFLVGIAYGRFGWGQHPPEVEEELFEPLPPGSPNALASQRSEHLADGIAVDDLGHDADLVNAIERVAEERWGGSGPAVVAVAADNLGCPSVRHWLAGTFFDTHLQRYSSSRRRAPIYWHLSTQSADYSVWLYYHALSKDSLYRALNEYVIPKLRHEERKLLNLRNEAGPDGSPSRRAAIVAQEALVGEIATFRDELARVAGIWSPDLNDGVAINFAPLWRLVPQNRVWQKECKKVWKKLCKGEYDWAHLAMHLWPERVVPKCRKDRSLAIAHGLEDVFWEEDSDGKWKSRKVDPVTVDELIAERSSAAVRDALQSLLDAPVPRTAGSKSRGRRTRKGRRPRQPSKGGAA